jgi:hypothetical protein
MYARVLFSWPSEPPYRPLTNEVAEVEPEIVNALGRLVNLTDGQETKNRRTLSHEDTRGDLPLNEGNFRQTNVAIWMFGSGRVKGSPIPGLRRQRRSGARSGASKGGTVPPDPLRVVYGDPLTLYGSTPV